MAKEVVRMMHKLRMGGHLIEENLFDFANALSDYLFTAALFANKITNTKEIPFESRSYL
jgi:cob(I)alamin adenosyltransferase